MSPRRITSAMTDMSGGIIGGISDYRRRPRWLRVLENMLLAPQGALSVRTGSQRFSSATLTDAPHSVAEWVSGGGTGHVFVGADNAGGGKVYEATAAAFNAQALPFPLAVSAKLVTDQLNGALWFAEQGGANPPFFFRSTNPANAMLTAILPRPAFPAIVAGTPISGPGIQAGTTVSIVVAAGATILTLSLPATATANVTLLVGTSPNTVAIPNCQTTNTVATVTYTSPTAVAQTQMSLAAVVGAGALTLATDYFYRLRFRYTDGSSRETINTQHLLLAGPQNTINITTIATEARSDYLGWTLERTKAGGTAAGPFYFLADGTGTTFTDLSADADLGYLSSVKTNNGEIHGEPPHLDGIIAYKDRLVGWAGSLLYFSQAVADIEATGIANWNPLAASAIGPDDGDTIKCVVRQVDRLIVLKRWSVWGVEGDDITSFRAFPLYSGAGCAGPRAAAAVGAAVYFWGDGGFHRIVGNNVAPFGWTEVGHLFATFKPGQNGDVVVKNYLGQYLLVSFSSSAGYNDDMLVYDLRFGGWVRITGWFAHDILVQKAGTFGNAQAIVMVDRKDRDPGAGFDYPVWLGFYNFLDEKSAAGTLGVPPNVRLETPMIDDNSPTMLKDWERIQMFLAGTSVAATVTIRTDPPGSVASVAITSSPAGGLWGAPLWGAFAWGVAVDAGPVSGLPAGTQGNRYVLGLTAAPKADMTFKGYSMDGTVQPTQDYSETI